MTKKHHGIRNCHINTLIRVFSKVSKAVATRCTQQVTGRRAGRQGRQAGELLPYVLFKDEAKLSRCCPIIHSSWNQGHKWSRAKKHNEPICEETSNQIIEKKRSSSPPGSNTSVDQVVGRVREGRTPELVGFSHCAINETLGGISSTDNDPQKHFWLSTALEGAAFTKIHTEFMFEFLCSKKKEGKSKFYLMALNTRVPALLNTKGPKALLAV